MWSDAAREASIDARKGAGGAAHQSKVMQALHKDRFTGLVPPGSKRDTAVKQAAAWAHAGLVKGAVIAAGGGPIGVAGAMTASYTKWGGDLVRKYGPAIAGKIKQIRAQRAAGRVQ